jgi:hypothetical protein
MSKPKSNLPRHVLDGLMKEFVLAKKVTSDERSAIYCVAQRVLRHVSRAALRRADNELACSICSETVKSVKGNTYYLDHTEDCPLSWVDPIRL